MIRNFIPKSLTLVINFLQSYSLILSTIFFALLSNFTVFAATLADVNAIAYPESKLTNISDQLIFHDASNAITVKALNPKKGEKKSITILSGDGKLARWVSFAISNPSDKMLKRLLVFPHYGAGNDGMLLPALSGSRISQLYSGSSLKLKLQSANGSDVFVLELPAKQTVTFIGRVAENYPSRASLWDIDAYKTNHNYLPFYQGLIIGILGLMAIFVTSLFIVKRKPIFVVSGVICWATLSYSLQEFGYLTVILPENAYLLALIRAVSETIISGAPLLLLHLFFNAKQTNKPVQLIMQSPIFIAAIAVIIAFIFPSLAASIARFNAILVTIAGFVYVIGHWSGDKHIIAKTLLPIWVVFSIWAVAQIYFAISSDIVYLNLLVGAIYLVFLLMIFIALLQNFTHDTVKTNEYSGTALPKKHEITPDNQTLAITDQSQAALAQNADNGKLPNLAISGSGQFLWEWDLLSAKIKCGTELDDLLHYEHGFMSNDTNEWIKLIHSRELPKIENILAVILQEGNARLDQDFRLRSGAGEYLWFELRAVAITDDEGYLTGFIGTLNEATARKKTEERLYQDAVNDSLTGLPNRPLFFDRLERAITRAKGNNASFPALLLFDISSFKAVNDSVGFAMGDSILMTVARRLEKYVNTIDTVARLNGDQFAIILNEYSDMNFVYNFAEKLQNIIASGINIDNQVLELKSNVGIAFVESSSELPDELLQKAELALGSAKQTSNDDIIIFSSELSSKGARFTRENDLRQAILRNEFEMFYQPIISLETMRPVGFEALIRWHHPTEGNVLPSDFIQLAEETGHIHELGKFALTQAAKQLNIWQRTFTNSEPLFVSVNMSSMQLFQPQLVEQVADVLNRFNVINESLKLEVTESLVMKNPELARQILQKLKDTGAGLACDDFGTGYSSLAYLHQFPFDVIKIDRSFISGENFGKTRPIILKAIIKLAQDLGLRVVAEGVETDGQAHELIDLGCELVQGFRFGEPMDAKNSLNFLSANFV